jgi:hypothetical protein
VEEMVCGGRAGGGRERRGMCVTLVRAWWYGRHCMYVWLALHYGLVVTGATGQRAGPGTPNDRVAEETLTTCALLAPATTPVLSMKVDGILPWPWLPSPNPLQGPQPGPGRTQRSQPVRATTQATLQHPYRNLHLHQLTEGLNAKPSRPTSTHSPSGALEATALAAAVAALLFLRHQSDTHLQPQRL